MPQLVVAALLGAGLYAGYRWLQRANALMTENLKRAEADLKQRAADGAGQIAEKDLGALEFDPKSGVYKPARRH
jgi:hypothetical protein